MPTFLSSLCPDTTDLCLIAPNSSKSSSHSSSSNITWGYKIHQHRFSVCCLTDCRKKEASLYIQKVKKKLCTTLLHCELSPRYLPSLHPTCHATSLHSLRLLHWCEKKFKSNNIHSNVSTDLQHNSLHCAPTSHRHPEGREGGERYGKLIRHVAALKDNWPCPGRQLRLALLYLSTSFHSVTVWKKYGTQGLIKLSASVPHYQVKFPTFGVKSFGTSHF